MTTATQNTVSSTVNTYHLRIGQSVECRDGRIVTIIDRERRYLNGTRRLVFNVQFADGSTDWWTSRKMTFARGGRDQSNTTTTTTTATATATTTTEPATTTQAGSLAEMLGAAIGPYVASKIDRDDVVQIINDRLAEMTLPREVRVTVADAPTVDAGLQHAMFEALLRCVANRLNVWLVGPAGSGKTSVAAAVAKALDLEFRSTSVCAMTSKSDLIGYRNVSNGEYVSTGLRQAYEHGGVFLLDEIDAGNPNVMVILNNLLANDLCEFPDGMVAKHADFVLIAGANTIGLGADSQYVGRNQLDKATVDRFVMLPFDYDPSIEAAMAGVPASAFDDMPKPRAPQFKDRDTPKTERVCERFCKRLVAIRKAIADLRVRHVVSPRATKAGCTMIRAGFSLDDTMQYAVWKGLDADTVAKIVDKAGIDA